jgi:signal transduction histidine kinase/DNA-binding response OmpR family regulator
MTGPIRVLHLEDSPRDAALIAHSLTAAGLSCDITVVDDEARFEAALREQEVDVVLCDYNLPGYDGFLALELARARRPGVPVLMISGTIDEEHAVECLHRGATDYLLKGRLERLPSAMRRALAEVGRARSAERVSAAFLRQSQRIRELHELTVATTLSDDYRIGEALRVGGSWFGMALGLVCRTERGVLGVEHRWSDALTPSAPLVAQGPLEGSCAADVLADGVPRALPGSHPPRHRAHPALPRGEVASYIGVPLIVHGRPYGTVEFMSGQARTEPFDDTDTASLQMLARWIGAVIGVHHLQEQVNRSQKMEAIGTLASSVAHDFNNLLSVIQCSTEILMLRLPPDDDQAVELQQVLEATSRATTLTRQLLTFSRKEVSKPQTVDLGVLLEKVSNMLRRLIGSDVTLEVTRAGEVLGAFVDAGQFEQVVMNLCLNARDAMPHGGVLSLSVDRVPIDLDFAAGHPWAQPGEFVRVSARDTGVGMDAETQARIFEPFFTTKSAANGTGLGLAVVYGIVQQHGGLINVVSRPGLGTTFELYFPHEPLAGQLEQLAREVALADAMASGESAPDLPTAAARTLLLVDDEDAIRRVATRLLTREGYTVVACANGPDALRAVEDPTSDIYAAMLDVVMPEMSGFELFRQLRERRPSLPVVFVTAYADQEHFARIRGPGVRLLEKPFEIERLAAVIREVVREMEMTA